MAQIDIIAAQLAQVIQWINDIEENARKTDEFPNETPLDTDSLLRVQNTAGNSQWITVGDIVDKATSYLGNKLIYFAGTTIVGNTVTLLSGSIWRFPQYHLSIGLLVLIALLLCLFVPS